MEETLTSQETKWRFSNLYTCLPVMQKAPWRQLSWGIIHDAVGFSVMNASEWSLLLTILPEPQYTHRLTKLDFAVIMTLVSYGFHIWGEQTCWCRVLTGSLIQHTWHLRRRLHQSEGLAQQGWETADMVTFCPWHRILCCLLGSGWTGLALGDQTYK